MSLSCAARLSGSFLEPHSRAGHSLYASSLTVAHTSSAGPLTPRQHHRGRQGPSSSISSPSPHPFIGKMPNSCGERGHYWPLVLVGSVRSALSSALTTAALTTPSAARIRIVEQIPLHDLTWLGSAFSRSFPSPRAQRARPGSIPITGWCREGIPRAPRWSSIAFRRALGLEEAAEGGPGGGVMGPQ